MPLAGGARVAVFNRLKVIRDRFNRGDDATSLGYAETGEAWTALNRTWGVSGGQAYQATNLTNARVVVRSAMSNGWVDVRLPSVGVGSGLMIRCTTNGNGIELWYDEALAVLHLSKVEANVYTDLSSVAMAINAGDILTLLANGSALAGYVNAIRKVSGTSTFNMTATEHGMRTDSNAARFDELEITPL